MYQVKPIVRQARRFDPRQDNNHAMDIMHWCGMQYYSNAYGFELWNMFGKHQVNFGDVVVQYEDGHFEMYDGNLWSEQNTELEPA